MWQYKWKTLTAHYPLHSPSALLSRQVLACLYDANPLVRALQEEAKHKEKGATEKAKERASKAQTERHRRHTSAEAALPRQGRHFSL